MAGNATPCLLEARDLVKRYPSASETVTPLDRLSLEIRQGDFALVFGPSGSGKTTLLNLLCGIDRPDEGSVSFDGRRVDDSGDKALTLLRRESLGVIFQGFELVPVMSCRENVEYPLVLKDIARAERRSRIRRMAAALDIEGILDRKPAQVSGGQRQRVAICRALVAGYRIVLGDEITGNLDQASAARVYDLLAAMNRDEGMTFLMVTHNTALTPYANKVYRLSGGTLAEEAV
ncbi:MAG: ABC transporter ATP-binding protein [Spirochaetales bacterium]|nr:ABC transporter ATP-binding protein [Spirochaetales bacterium]